MNNNHSSKVIEGEERKAHLKASSALGKAKCSVEGCNREIKFTGYCYAHYRYAKKHNTIPTHLINIRDGRSRHPNYSTYTNMISRCYNKDNHAYKDYGGRGIKVCERWRKSFWNFLEDMGETPEGYSIDRINNDGDYEPTNCRQATKEIQANNKQFSQKLTAPNLAKLTGYTAQNIWYMGGHGGNALIPYIRERIKVKRNAWTIFKPEAIEYLLKRKRSKQRSYL